MIKSIIAFFVVVGIIALLVTKPVLILLIAVFLAGFYICKERPDLFSSGANSVKSEEPEPETIQEIYKRQIDEELKPGFEEDPEWQKRRDKLREVMEKNQRQEDANMEKEAEKCP